MNILIISNFYPPHVMGGAESMAAILAEELAASGMHVSVVTTCGPNQSGIHRENRNGVDVYRFFPQTPYWGFERGNRSLMQRVRFHLQDCWNTYSHKVINRLIDMLNPDIVHSHNIDGFSPSAWAAAHNKGIPVVHTAHDYHLICPRSTLQRSNQTVCGNQPLPCRAYARYYGTMSRYVDILCSPSQFLIDRHHELTSLRCQTRVVRNGIPFDPFKDTKPDGPTRFLFLGQLQRIKGIETLVDAMDLLPPDLDIRLHIAGRGPLESLVQELIARDSRVSYHGFVDGQHKANLLGITHMLVFPSQCFENAPVSILEAYAHRVGVIASDFGAVPEFVEHDKTGLLFELKSPQALADAMVKVHKDPSAAIRYGAHGADLVKAFRIEAMRDAYLNVYRSLTDIKTAAA